MNKTDRTFSSNTRPRNKLNQIGSNIRGSNSFAYHYSVQQRLKDYEFISIYDTTVAACLKIIINTTVSSLGDIEHIDPDIEKFCRYNINFLEMRNSMSSFKNILKLALHTSKSMGFCVGETLYTVNKDSEEYNDTLLIEDLAIYHPSTIILRPNKQGRLVEGDFGLDGRPTGVWQRTYDGHEVLLKQWKIVHLVNNFYFNSYYGRSDIESIEKHVLIKDYLLDLRNEALKNYGKPLVSITIPVNNTTETIINPTTGEERFLTTFDITKQEIIDTYENSGGDLLLLPMTDPAMKPDAKAVVSGINVGSVFENALISCDKEIARGLNVPFIMVSSDVNIRAGAERQIEIFNQVIKDTYDNLVVPFVNQFFGEIIRYNFKGRATAEIPPVISFKNKMRPEDKVALMQMITGLTSKGYYNPLNPLDWLMVRDLVGSDNRPMESSDKKYINDILITPLQKNEVSSSSGKPTGTTDNTRDRSKEGIVKGDKNSGRPVGTSSPQQNPR